MNILFESSFENRIFILFSIASLFERFIKDKKVTIPLFKSRLFSSNVINIEFIFLGIVLILNISYIYFINSPFSIEDVIEIIIRLYLDVPFLILCIL